MNARRSINVCFRMKSRLFLCILLFAAFAGAGLRAVESARNYGADMSVNADVQADFYKRYPDLEDERDVVAAAARTLAAENMETQDVAAAAELLAKRTRALLERRTPTEWQQKAMTLFPELRVAGSEFNALFLRHFNELKQTSPQFLEEPSWPVLLARRCADELKGGTASATHKASKKIQAPPPIPAAPVAAPAEPPGPRPPSKWVAVLIFCLLLAIIVQPARLLLRWRRAFGGSDGPVTLWQRALGPAAWTYLAFALFALIRTFQANADQRPSDRFGITLFVSLLTGVAFAAPVYLVTFAVIWWGRHRTPPAVASKDPATEVPAQAPVPAGGRKV